MENLPMECMTNIIKNLHPFNLSIFHKTSQYNKKASINLKNLIINDIINYNACSYYLLNGCPFYNIRHKKKYITHNSCELCINIPTNFNGYININTYYYSRPINFFKLDESNIEEEIRIYQNEDYIIDTTDSNNVPLNILAWNITNEDDISIDIFLNSRISFPFFSYKDVRLDLDEMYLIKHLKNNELQPIPDICKTLTFSGKYFKDHFWFISLGIYYNSLDNTEPFQYLSYVISKNHKKLYIINSNDMTMKKFGKNFYSFTNLFYFANDINDNDNINIKFRAMGIPDNQLITLRKGSYCRIIPIKLHDILKPQNDLEVIPGRTSWRNERERHKYIYDFIYSKYKI